ncbi:MAG: TIR domain-containing protein [Chloroflexi bacterium]|nr:TIR domain-containing protein [Chloroflexota bacterium]
MTNRTARGWDFFIAYPQANCGWVENYLMRALNEASIRYHSEAAFTPGEPRVLQLQYAVEHSAHILIVLSSAYHSDDLAQFTALLTQFYGIEESKWPLIPIILDNAKLPTWLNMLMPLDARAQANWDKIVERLCELVGPIVRAPARQAPCPYPGMKKFEEKNHQQFFGREDEIQAMLRHLRAYPFLAIIGSSGCGKSSLVSAGLVPKLGKTNLVGAGEWVVREMRPKDAPLTNLRAAVGDDLAVPAQTIARLIASKPSAHQVLLIVDQFEEMFTARAEVNEFQTALLDLIQIPNCYIVLTARSDFYPAMMESRLWHEIQAHRFEIVRLKGNALREAILKPAEAVHVFIEPALIERLMADAGDEPGIMPFVQETLVLLWEHLDHNYLGTYAYDKLMPTEAVGARMNGLYAAIEFHARQLLEGLEIDQRAMARRVFLDLVRLDKDGRDTRRQRLLTDLRLPSDDRIAFEQMLKLFNKHRLLTFSGEPGADRQVDIAHETLIAGWRTLHDWIEHDRPWLLIQRRLEDAADAWVERSRDPGYLYSASQLKQVDAFESHARDLTAREQDFLAASRNAIKLEQRARRRQTVVRAGFMMLAFVFGVTLFTLAGMFVTQTWIFATPEPPGIWTRGENLKAFITAIQSDARDSKILYAATRNQGVFKSSDWGAHWQTVLSFADIGGEAQSLAAIQDSVFIGAQGGRVFRSEDQGARWNELARVPGAKEITDLVVDPLDANILYACDGGDPNLYISRDRGTSWQTMRVPGAEAGLATIAIARVNDRATILYAATREKIFYSANGAANWQSDDSLAPFDRLLRIVPRPTDAAELYVGTYGGLYYLQRKDDRFAARRIDDRKIATFAVDVRAPNSVIASGVDGSIKLIQQRDDQFRSLEIGHGSKLENSILVGRVAFGDRKNAFAHAATENGFWNWTPSSSERAWLEGK